jgi:ATP-dependent NAD(P)H-hydrate dehydratase
MMATTTSGDASAMMGGGGAVGGHQNATSPVSWASAQGAHGTPSEAELLRRLRALVPPLDGSSYKGSHGKVGVVGGCAQYTGAPAFAAVAALRCGADLAYVFCTPDAAPVIKSYSPELIVLPCLPDSRSSQGMHEYDAAERFRKEAEPWVSRLGCLVVGPGLGDDPLTCRAAREILGLAIGHNIPVIIDGSAITHVACKGLLDLVGGWSLAVLTPNLAEMGRLLRAAHKDGPSQMADPGDDITDAWQSRALQLSQFLGIEPGSANSSDGVTGPVVVSKGPRDVVAQSPGVVGDAAGDRDAPVMPGGALVCDAPASLKRSGGQGDVLTGIMATLLCWARRVPRPLEHGPDVQLAAWGACWLTRQASASAFAAKGRAMLAGDMLDPHVADAVRKLERGCV